jgi:hypothetical protein
VGRGDPGARRPRALWRRVPASLGPQRKHEFRARARGVGGSTPCTEEPSVKQAGGSTAPANSRFRSAPAIRVPGDVTAFPVHTAEALPPGCRLAARQARGACGRRKASAWVQHGYRDPN